MTSPLRDQINEIKEIMAEVKKNFDKLEQDIQTLREDLETIRNKPNPIEGLRWSKEKSLQGFREGLDLGSGKNNK